MKWHGLPILLLASCTSSSPADGPEEAHKRFVDGLRLKNYDSVFAEMDASTIAFLQNYIDSTREASELIRSLYPKGAVFSGLRSLNLPLPAGALRVEDVDTSRHCRGVFLLFCQAFFAEGTELGGLQSWAMSALETSLVDSTHAIVVTLVGDTLHYVREDGRWKTPAIFRPHFEDMSQLATVNLEIVRKNIETFSR